jgi:hypothetical protein
MVPINNKNIMLKKSPRIYKKLVAPSLATKTHLVVQKPCNIQTWTKIK